MARRSNGKPEYVVCLSNRGYSASLVIRRIYRNLLDPGAAKRNLVRVIDESGEDYLYPARLFAAIAIPQAAEKAFKKAS
jgi:hypothetical protein